MIYPFSIGKYLAETEHSATCLNKHRTPVKGVTLLLVKINMRYGTADR